MQSNIPHPTSNIRSTERGNVFIFILLGIVLFSALAFTISRGMQSDTADNLSGQEVGLAASDILLYAQKIERTINRLRRNGCSESELSFENSVVTGYSFSTRDACKVFGGTGGALRWVSPQFGVNDATEWHFTGRTCIPTLETGGTGCHNDSDSKNEELILILPNVVQKLCSKINDKLNISSIPSDTGGNYSATKFVGSFSDNTKIVLPSTYNSVCYLNGSNYHFYHVLLAR